LASATCQPHDRRPKAIAHADRVAEAVQLDMAREAERLLEGAGWLPEPLRLRVTDASGSPDVGDPEALPAFLADDADGEPRAVAAE